MSEMPCSDYLNMVDDLLEARYGITSSDVGMGAIARCQDDGWSAQECVEWIAGKWELVRVSDSWGEGESRAKLATPRRGREDRQGGWEGCSKELMGLRIIPRASGLSLDSPTART